MSFLFIKTIWSNMEFGLIKICFIALGILLGIYFNEFLTDYASLLWIVFLVTAAWTCVLWIKKMKATLNSKAK